MKKLSISFILLFGFLAFIPQSVLGDLIIGPGHNRHVASYKKQTIEQKENDLKKKYFSCLQKYKSKLPKEYKEPNLKIIPDSIQIKRELGKSRSSYKPDISFHTGNKYFIDVDDQTDKKYIVKYSLAFNCSTEHILISGGGFVNVTDVVPGSHLKYIQGTDEIQVLPPNDKPYIENEMKILDYDEKLAEQINQGLKRKYEEDFKCLNEKKEELSMEYVGPNLKYETILSDNDIARLQKENHCMEKYLSFDTTHNIYNINFKNKNVGRRQTVGQVCGCEEYITVNQDKETYVYNVTNVPPNSTLQFISNTKEMQVSTRKKESIEKQFKEYINIKNKLMCLYNKKLKLPRKYKSSNLKLIQNKKRERYFGSGLEYMYIYDDNNPFSKDYSLSLNNKDNMKIKSLDSIINYDGTECKEYIYVSGDTTSYYGTVYSDIANMEYYDVTNIPAGSYLKYIPETKEMQVFSQEDNFYNSYKRLIKNKLKDMENKEDELQENIALGKTKLMAPNLKQLGLSIGAHLCQYVDWELVEKILEQEKEKTSK